MICCCCCLIVVVGGGGGAVNTALLQLLHRGSANSGVLACGAAGVLCGAEELYNRTNGDSERESRWTLDILVIRAAYCGQLCAPQHIARPNCRWLGATPRHIATQRIEHFKHHRPSSYMELLTYLRRFHGKVDSIIRRYGGDEEMPMLTDDDGKKYEQYLREVNEWLNGSY